MRVAALGRTQWLRDTIETLSSKGHEICQIGVITESPESSVTSATFNRLAQKLGCPSFQANRVGKREKEVLRAVQADVAVSVNWPTLIPRSVRDLFPHGVLNAHAGDLPRYRGNACPNWAILQGEQRVTVSIHQMIDDLDAGPVYLKRHITITDHTYITEIYGALDTMIPDMFLDVVDGLDRGAIAPVPQSEGPALGLRCFPRLPSDSRIDWSHSATDITRLIRASAKPFAGAYTHLNNQRLTIWKAHSSQLGYPYLGLPGQVVKRDLKSGAVTVLAGIGTVVLESVAWSRDTDKKPSECVRSLRSRLGIDWEQQLENLSGQVEALRTQVEAFQQTSFSTDIC